MKVLKWQTAIARGNSENENKLLENKWEPFACDGQLIIFRRPVGYIEIEEKVVNEQTEPVITKEVTFNLDKIEKI